MAVPIRLLTVKLTEKIVPDQRVENYITFRGDRLDLDESLQQELKSLLPEMWHTSKDRLSYFAYYDNNSFICQKVKQIYNFSLKDTEEKLYNYTSATEDQVAQFVSTLEKYYLQFKLRKSEQAYDKIISQLSDVSYLKYQIIEMRQKSLTATDYMFNKDYIFKNSQEELEWKTYRQEWRDITEQEAWKNCDFLNVVLPVSPKPRDQLLDLFQNIGTQLLSSDIPKSITDKMSSTLQELYANNELDHIIKNYVSITLKVEVLKSFSKLRLPIGGSIADLDAIKAQLLQNNILSEETIDYLNTTDTNLMNNYLTNIENKIATIDEKLKEYNVNFSVSEIINQYALDMSEKVKKMELEQSAMELLSDVVLDNEEV